MGFFTTNQGYQKRANIIVTEAYAAALLSLQEKYSDASTSQQPDEADLIQLHLRELFIGTLLKSAQRMTDKTNYTMSEGEKSLILFVNSLPKKKQSAIIIRDGLVIAIQKIKPRCCSMGLVAPIFATILRYPFFSLKNFLLFDFSQERDGWRDIVSSLMKERQVADGEIEIYKQKIVELTGINNDLNKKCKKKGTAEATQKILEEEAKNGEFIDPGSLSFSSPPQTRSENASLPRSRSEPGSATEGASEDGIKENVSEQSHAKTYAGCGFGTM